MVSVLLVEYGKLSIVSRDEIHFTLLLTGTQGRGHGNIKSKGLLLRCSKEVRKDLDKFSNVFYPNRILV